MAAAAVIDFFERLSDGGLFDGSHLRKLWLALRKDTNASGAQFAKCLLVYIAAPEKHETDKVIPRCIKEWAGQMPAEPWAEEVISVLLGQLAAWIPHAAKHSRVRVLDLILSVLRGVRREMSLEEGVRTAVVKSLREHLPDKDDKVRQLVVIALTKLGFPQCICIACAAAETVMPAYLVETGTKCSICGPSQDGEGDAEVSELLAELTDALHSDLSQDVRLELVNRLPLDKPTLLEVLRHQSDRSAKVAAAVYDRVARDVAMAKPATPGGLATSVEQRTSLMWYGLHEPRTAARKAAQGLLAKWFTEDAAGDVVKLVEVFNPQANAELCQLIMEQLVEHSQWDPQTAPIKDSIPQCYKGALHTYSLAPQAWLKAETAAGRSLPDLLRVAEQFKEQHQQARSGAAGRSGGAVGSWLTGVSPALATVWVFASRKVTDVATGKGRVAAEKVAGVVAQVEASAGAQAETVLEAFLPVAQQMAKLCLLAAEAGPSYRYITTQLLESATLSYMLARPDGAEPPECKARDSFQPASSSGRGAWEAAVLQFAAAVYGSDRSGLVHSVLPMVLELADSGRPSEHGGRIHDDAAATAAEGPLLQALTFLHLLMAAAGPSVPPSASAPAPLPAAAGAACSSSDGSEPSWTLAQAVDRLAWTASGNPSPAVRAAAIRCYVELCLRDGGAAHLPRAGAVLAPLLPAVAASSAAAATATVAYDGDDDRDFVAQQQLPRRVALQGLLDLSLTWGEPTLTTELRKATAAAEGQRHVDDVTAQLATLGMNGSGSGQQPTAAAAAAAAAGSERHGVGSEVHMAARGAVADALLGSARLVHGWPFQLRLKARLRHQPRQAEQLLTRLLLARFSPSLESEPWLRSQLSAFFKSFQEAASAAGDDGAVHRRMLAGSFLHAARYAMALPAPVGAPATARGCAAPALMEFTGELLASAAAAVIPTAVATGDVMVSREDAQDQAAAGAAAAAAAAASAVIQQPVDAVVELCELVLEEVVRLGSPGSASLDTSEGRVRAYAAELCKTPMRLLPGLPFTGVEANAAGLTSIRRLAYLGRRAVLAVGESLVKTVVPDTAYKKLQEFVRELEELQKAKTAPLSKEDAQVFLQTLKEQLKDRLEELPSLEDVTAELAPDDDCDALRVDASRAGATADQARARKRGTAARGSRGKASAGTNTRTTRQAGKAASSRGPSAGVSRRNDTRNTADADSDTDSDGGDFDSQDDGGGEDGSTAKALTAAVDASKAAKGRSRGAGPASHRQAASQGTTEASDSCSQPGRRSVRAAAAKASEKLEALRIRGSAENKLI
ncbi:hypothetical protein VOLCADRAFT_105050 [Volvox carteri f. nagariensis]|uniref:Uncharacterized protein n=1 Tax=Volvox carteri f. nagariensis TaxID=3068 RepID=D8TY20_VOLCA|nr:uncharacterized protein VOLCADRAFT_105050 [Volvox carteri f. nagariensis]EFJ47474.1 hypothetical protein VOLCADRAFT_105050 [Volvox carteri f. nagariensis]|eukprot:XP_002951298.1 hypothetical protein VOLCADRAFT_105050 [Volvox carteri f. nagariensis]